MCTDNDCLFRAILEEQFRQDIRRQYEDRHKALWSSHSVPVHVEYPSSDRMEKMVKKRINYTVKYWSKHRPF